MFIRKKKNRSGTTSVVVVDKPGGKFKELHTVGISSDPTEIDRLCMISKDIGMYNTCRHFWVYCYANRSMKVVI